MILEILTYTHNITIYCCSASSCRHFFLGVKKDKTNVREVVDIGSDFRGIIYGLRICAGVRR